jgi:hypothetical protein
VTLPLRLSHPASNEIFTHDNLEDVKRRHILAVLAYHEPFSRVRVGRFP